MAKHFTIKTSVRGSNGAVFKPGDEDKLAEVITREQYDRLSKAGHVEGPFPGKTTSTAETQKPANTGTGAQTSGTQAGGAGSTGGAQQ
jgi:hypothetical protein